MTSFNPLPAHLIATQDESAGSATPSYGGTVETGAEWDFVIDRNGRRRYGVLTDATVLVTDWSLTVEPHLVLHTGRLLNLPSIGHHLYPN